MTGKPLIVASWAGTGVFAATALPAAAGAESAEYASVVVALVLFVASIPISLYALAVAAVRTARQGERITVTGLYFLRGSAPAPVRRHLLGSLAVTLIVIAVTAPTAPFGILVPVYQMGLAGLWSARYGSFPPIPEPSR